MIGVGALPSGQKNPSARGRLLSAFQNAPVHDITSQVSMRGRNNQVPSYIFTSCHNMIQYASLARDDAKYSVSCDYMSRTPADTHQYITDRDM